jgi:zona occludens toxin (predicted ATPase)
MERSSILRLIFILAFAGLVAYALMELWKRNQVVKAKATPAEQKVWSNLEQNILFFFALLVFFFVVWQVYESFHR